MKTIDFWPDALAFTNVKYSKRIKECRLPSYKESASQWYVDVLLLGIHSPSTWV